MQVRAIEFQENFRLVSIEGARQQSLLLRAPDLGQQQMVRMVADEQVLSLNRPNPSTQTEGNIIDPNTRRFPERRSGPERGSGAASGGPRPDSEEEEGQDRPAGATGRRVDVVA